MPINIIASIDKFGCMGKNNDIPWHIPSEINFFKEKTENKTVIMGKNTWNSLLFKPLINRENIIISRSPHETGDKIASLFDVNSINKGTTEYPVIVLENNIIVVGNIEDAIKQASSEIFFIGGGEIFQRCLKYVNKIFLNKIDYNIHEGNVFFPNLNMLDWDQERIKQEKSYGYEIEFFILTRKNY